MEGTSLTYFADGYCRHCKCVRVLWKIGWGCLQGNVKNDVNYFLQFVACACIYACVYVVFAVILELYVSDDCAEELFDMPPKELLEFRTELVNLLIHRSRYRNRSVVPQSLSHSI